MDQGKCDVIFKAISTMDNAFKTTDLSQKKSLIFKELYGSYK